MNAKISYDLFNKIRSQFSNIQIGDSTGQPTADPQEAVFFDFEFKEDADTFGRVSISLADGENMKVFYNRDLVSKIDEDSRDEWYAFLKELKDFAVEHQLAFDVRDITKSNLTKQDYKNLADTNATVNTDGMSEELNRITKLAGVEVKEGLTGTSKSSYENLDKTRLIIRHSGPVDENVPGARSRHINSLYIENEDGERFKYPITHLAGARAMTRHVANGGRPHDEFGQHIIKTSENIAQLNSFSRYVSHKDQLNDNAGDIIEQTKLKLENLRAYIKNLGKQTHYDEASKNFKPSAIADLSDDERSAYREKFTMKHLDDRVENVLPLIHNIMQEYEPEPAGEPEPKTEPIVDHGAVVQGFLSDPAKKLVLRKDDSADRMLSVTKFTNNNTMLGSILSDIASRMLTRDDNEERVANFASRVADGLENEGEDFLQKLDGFWSFAYYDESVNQIMLSRDLLGEKSLFYYQNKNEFIFASEINPILEVAEENFEIDRSTKKIDERTNIQIKIGNILIRATPIMEILTGIMIAGFIYYSGFMIASGQMQINNFFSFLTAMMLAYQPIRSLATINMMFYQGATGAERVFKVLDKEPDIKGNENYPNLKIDTGSIEFENVSFVYPETEVAAVKNINISVKGLSLIHI